MNDTWRIMSGWKLENGQHQPIGEELQFAVSRRKTRSAPLSLYTTPFFIAGHHLSLLRSLFAVRILLRSNRFRVLHPCFDSGVSIFISSLTTLVIFGYSDRMALEQDFPELAAQHESDGDVSLQKKWKAISASEAASENSNGSFDCNICLDSAHDPVVTLCGHLYCWPCIYKWLHVQSTSPVTEQQQNCPVCKANISHTSLVPLYGRGPSPSESETKKLHVGPAIPRRPPAHGVHTVLNPTIGMFGEMVFSRMFGSSDTSLFAYPYPNTYPLMASANPRMRRQEMQLDRCLNRVSIFLFCCFILCLLSF
ncbi:unnamed protein product, partial [Vitis vinifera]